MYDVEMPDKRTIRVLGTTEPEGARFYHAAQNGAQCKRYELFISRIFHLLLSDLCRPRVTETMESETADKGDHCI